MDTNTQATYTATGALINALDDVTSNVTGKTNVFLFSFFKDGIAYVRVIDNAGTQRNAYAKNYGITVRAIAEEQGNENDNITTYTEAMPRTIARWFKLEVAPARIMHDDDSGSTYERTIAYSGENYTAHYNSASGLLTITQNNK
jgi:hypothetical protein